MPFPKNIPFHLFASCVPVRGAIRSIIYDLQRNDFQYIPNIIFEILTEHTDTTFNDLLQKIDNELLSADLLNTYLNFLLENEFIFFSKLPHKYFPNYDITCESPYGITCFIVDFNNIDSIKINKIKKELISIKPQCLILRFFELEITAVHEIFLMFEDIPCRTIHLYIDNNNFENTFLINNFFNLNNRLSIFIKFNSNDNKTYQSDQGLIIDTTLNLSTEKSEINNISDFNVNLELFMESKLYNNFFYKRLFIDKTGEVHRFENDDIKFGNVSTVSLKNIISSKNFKEFWNITKDSIEICNCCEYRYMCVDNRKPISKGLSGLWKLEDSCNYNPLTAKWNN